MGETGEICVRGNAVFAGYFENDEANAKAFAGGWFSFGFNSGGRPRCHPSYGGYGYSYCAPPA